MHLTTQQKLQYLDAMGIQSWYPRAHLALAPDPVMFDQTNEPANPTPEQEALTGPVSVDRPVSESVPPPPPRSSVQPPVGGASVQAAPVEPPPQQPTATKPIHFGLGLYVLGPWLVVSSLSAHYQSQQDPAFRLLLGILRQFNNLDEEPAYHHVIAWPFFSNPNADQGKQAANQYVNGVIEHLIEEHQVTRILALGGVLAKLNDWDSAEGDCFGLPRLNLPSLYKMLEDPRQKAKAWHLIQKSSLYQS